MAETQNVVLTEGCQCASPQGQVKFCVPLVFQQVLTSTTGITGLVPLSTIATNNENISGILKLKFNSNASRLAYRVYIYNANNNQNLITGVTLNSGVASQNGPAILSLFNGIPRNSNGLLVKGVLGNNDIIQTVDANGINFNSIASLFDAMRHDEIYAVVTNQQFPDGVLRGQIFSS